MQFDVAASTQLSHAGADVEGPIPVRRRRGTSSTARNVPNFATYPVQMDADHIKTRLHDSLHRGRGKVTEEELEDVSALVLAIATELAAELAVVIADLAERVEALEAASAAGKA